MIFGAILTGPPSFVILALICNNPFVRKLFFGAGGYLCGLVILGYLLHLDCGSSAYGMGQCNLFPQGLADRFFLASLVLGAIHFVAAFILLLPGILCETGYRLERREF